MTETNPSPQTEEVSHPKTAAALKRHSRPLPPDVVLLSKADVARALGVSLQSIERWTRSGYLKALKLGNGSVRAPRRYRSIDVAEFIEGRLNPVE